MNSTILDLLRASSSAAPALSAPGRAGLSHGALHGQVLTTLAWLNARGIGRNDRVAIVLPNGPEMASSFLACAAGVTSAPRKSSVSFAALSGSPAMGPA